MNRSDDSLDKTLRWALDRMNQAGYTIRSDVKMIIDPALSFMGYAREKDGVQYIVTSEWALDSEMLRGFLLHELAHIYSTEMGLPSHDHELIEDVINEFREREGLNERETVYLMDAFSHLQNVIVDDIVFDVMTDKEKKTAQRFFEGWITSKPTGESLVDAAALIRNAFAVASLKRRGLFEEGSSMDEANKQFLSLLGNRARLRFNAVESFFEKAKADEDEESFRKTLSDFLELVISISRDRPQLEDLR